MLFATELYFGVPTFRSRCNQFLYRDLILKHILSKVDAALSVSQLSTSTNVLEALYFSETT